MSEHGTTTIAAMMSAFPVKPPTRDGRPDLKYLLFPCLRHICSCAMSHRTPGQPMGKLYLALRQQSYGLHTAQPYPQRTPDPGETAVYQGNETATQRKAIDNTFEVAYKRHHDENTMDQALISRLYALLDEDHAQTLRDNVSRIPNPTFHEVFDNAVRKWGQTTPQSRLDNINALTAPWDAAEGVDKLFRRLRDCANYAQFAGHPIQDAMLVDSALICIQRTQAYTQAYLDFKQEVDQSFGALIVFFDEAENNRNEVVTEAGSMGYGMAATDSLTDDDDTTQQFRRTLTDFAASMAANEKEYTERSNAAATQQQQMAAALQQMQQSLSQLNAQMAMAARPGPQQQQQQFLPQQQQCQPVPPFQQQPFQPQQQPWQQRQQQQPQRPPNVKRFENWNYCWTHGCDLPDGHTSATCYKPAQGHQFQATHNNPMGGNPKNSHKTVLPSQAGFPPARVGGGRGRGRGGGGGRGRGGGGGRGRGNWNQQNTWSNQQNNQQFGGYATNPQWGGGFSM